MKRINPLHLIPICLGLLGTPKAEALNILVTNDDGFETANIQALLQTLQAAGHSVIVSAPAQNQSGTGASLAFLTPLTPMTKASRYGSVAAGAPGVGVDPLNANIYYVNSTPVASLLYGLDVLAPSVWSAMPDLVISGPNEGANTGMIDISSGTDGNMVYGTNRGIPSIAVSYRDPVTRAYTTLGDATDPAFKLANVVLQIVNTLQANAASTGALLPPGVGLNINVPQISDSCTPAKYTLTQQGVATFATPVFYADISQDPLAASVGLGNVHFPGVGILLPGMSPPAGVVLPADSNTRSEENVGEARCLVTISPIDGVMRKVNRQGSIKRYLRGLPFVNIP